MCACPSDHQQPQHQQPCVTQSSAWQQCSNSWTFLLLITASAICESQSNKQGGISSFVYILQNGPSLYSTRGFTTNIPSGSVTLYHPPCYLPLATISNEMLVTLQSIKITDTQGAEVLSINIKDAPGSRVTATSEAKRPLEFIQVRHLTRPLLKCKPGSGESRVR